MLPFKIICFIVLNESIVKWLEYYSNKEDADDLYKWND